MYAEQRFSYHADRCPIFSNLLVALSHVIVTSLTFIFNQGLCNTFLVVWSALMAVFHFESIVYFVLCIYVHKRNGREHSGRNYHLMMNLDMSLPNTQPPNQGPTKAYKFIEDITINYGSTPFMYRIAFKLVWRMAFCLAALIMLCLKARNCCGDSIERSMHFWAIAMNIFDTVFRIAATVVGGVVLCLIKVFDQVRRKMAARRALQALPSEPMTALSPVEKDHLINEVKECAICLEFFNESHIVTRLPCNGKHVFHTQCITNWVFEQNSCPMCRIAVSP
eukprot:TRINITY_DN1873_c0_g3_i1.p1 TRINITY_DN1873_c0_g3~~TRINITY_DN1873_c0_g3_i1.p1  ORF type:complete len:279 (-),score=41.09 TRINITY_DN1873_c0_g3_i1:97-933(-)